ncbi:MAG: DUF6775 family putative metallopeptidase [Candidatus Hydrothermarchaeales archaeon]
MLVYIYSDMTHDLNLKEVVGYLKRETLFEADIRGDFLEYWAFPKELSKKLAGIIIKDYTKQNEINPNPSMKDISFETRLLESKEPILFDAKHVYEGFELERIFQGMIKGKGFHVVFTSRMLATWGGNRYHGRTIICSYPLALISTTGLVEAPARPREYYARLLARQKAEQMGFQVPDEEKFKEELKEEFKDRMLDYDERLTEVIKGYVLQALSFFLTQEAFCDDPGCRLYNAHTQEEMINAQLKIRMICKRHRKILKGR